MAEAGPLQASARDFPFWKGGMECVGKWEELGGGGGGGGGGGSNVGGGWCEMRRQVVEHSTRRSSDDQNINDFLNT